VSYRILLCRLPRASLSSGIARRMGVRQTDVLEQTGDIRTQAQRAAADACALEELRLDASLSAGGGIHHGIDDDNDYDEDRGTRVSVYSAARGGGGALPRRCARGVMPADVARFCCDAVRFPIAKGFAGVRVRARIARA
jgi:hypothetical protein